MWASAGMNLRSAPAIRKPFNLPPSRAPNRQAPHAITRGLSYAGAALPESCRTPGSEMPPDGVIDSAWLVADRPFHVNKIRASDLDSLWQPLFDRPLPRLAGRRQGPRVLCSLIIGNAHPDSDLFCRCWESIALRMNCIAKAPPLSQNRGSAATGARRSAHPAMYAPARSTGADRALTLSLR